MEIEAKFRTPDEETLGRLREAGDIAGFPLGSPSTKQFTDVYLDTEDRRVLAGGFYCRRRLSGLQVLITVKQVDALPAKPRRAATKTKTPAGPVHRREEFEVELAADSPPDTWPESLARDKVLALSGGAPLVELFELQQDRTKRLVGAAENPVAELSLDVVRLRSGVGGALPAAGTPGVALLEGRAYFEVEVELLEGGSETDLAAIAGELQTAWALEPETRSKFERALEVLGEGSSAAAAGTGTTEPSEATASLAAGPLAPEVAVENAAEAAATEAAAEEDRDLIPVREAEDDAVDEAEETPRLKVGKRKCKRARDTFLGDGLELLEKPGLQAGDTMAEAARKTLLYHLQKMMQHEPGTREGEDPEELHDMRVATRRMRAALRVFEDYLAMDRYKPFLKVMRETGRELGAVRDLDVFMLKTQAYIESLPEEARSGLDPLVEAWKTERERAREELLAYLDCDRYERFKEKFEAFLRTPGAGVGRTTGPDGEPAPTRVGDVLPGVLFDRLALVKAYDGPISRPDAPLSVFHQLRITSKGLRYTLEFFHEVLGGDSKPLIDRMKQVQDHLGDLQDAVVTCDVLLGFLGSGTWGPPRMERKGARAFFPVNAPGVATYLAVKQNEIERLTHTFGPLWELVRGAEFSRPLAKLVASL